MPTTANSSTSRGRLRRFALQANEVVEEQPGDQHKQHRQEFALLDQVRLAGLEDDLRDVEHRLMGRQGLDLSPQVQAEAQRADDHERTEEQQVPGVNGLAGDREFAFASGRESPGWLHWPWPGYRSESRSPAAPTISRGANRERLRRNVHGEASRFRFWTVGWFGRNSMNPELADQRAPLVADRGRRDPRR